MATKKALCGVRPPGDEDWPACKLPAGHDQPPKPTKHDTEEKWLALRGRAPGPEARATPERP